MIIMKWFCDRNVYGESGLPWSSELYNGDRDPVYDMTNIEKTDATHFMMAFHEGLGDEEVADVIEAMAKVEAAYLK